MEPDAGDNLRPQGKGASAMTGGMIVYRCHLGRGERRRPIVSAAQQNRRKVPCASPQAAKNPPNKAAKRFRLEKAGQYANLNASQNPIWGMSDSSPADGHRLAFVEVGTFEFAKRITHNINFGQACTSD